MAAPDPPPEATRWTLVRRAGRCDPAAEDALAELCGLYWQPVFRFLRSEGRTDDAARELTQEFFARLLHSGSIGAEPARGRFRSYLLGAVKHFLQDQRAHDRRQKRGGGRPLEPLPEEHTAAGPPAAIPSVGPAEDTHFDREWALLILERALGAVSTAMRGEGKEAAFTVLKPWLTGAGAGLSQAEAATRLGLSEGATKVAIHRLRQRFRDAVRREIAQTVDQPADIDDEVRYLVEVLAASGP